MTLFDAFGWAAMAFIVSAVWFYSEGKVRDGNWLTCFGCTCWIIVGLENGPLPWVLLNLILFSRAAWKIVKKPLTNRL